MLKYEYMYNSEKNIHEYTLYEKMSNKKESSVMRNMRYHCDIKIEPIYEHVMNNKYQMIIRDPAQGRDTFPRTGLTSYIRREKDLSISVGSPPNVGRLLYMYTYIYVPDASSRIAEGKRGDTPPEIEPVQFRGNAHDFARLPEFSHRRQGRSIL